MICLNASNDSSDSAISYSSMSLSSSPVRSASIQQLLESPIIKPNSQPTNSQNIEKISEVDITLEANDEIIVAESPESTPVGSQETNENSSDGPPTEVANSQEEQINSTLSETNTQNNCRNSFRRQASVCVSSIGPINMSIASSPRALAILKNAIKSGLNSNIISDKTTNFNGEEVVKSDNNSNNGFNSPPSNKLFRNSPLSRGSALLRAAKERLEKQELERSPKLINNQMVSESSYDRQLTGILRKHELTASPTSDEPRPKKKKVLFAEPVVSSELEFKTSPSPSPFSTFQPIADLLPKPLDIHVSEFTSKQNRILVHQDSTFDKEYDSDSQHSDSPLLFTDESETEVVIPSCGQPIVDTEIIDKMEDIDESSQTSNVDLNFNTNDKLVSNSVDKEIEMILGEVSSQSSEDLFQCSQPMPENLDFDEDLEGRQSVAIQTEEPEEDPILMVPMRLSQIRDIYKLFGSLIDKYSDS